MLKYKLYSKFAATYQPFVIRPTWNLEKPGIVTVENVFQCIDHKHQQEGLPTPPEPSARLSHSALKDGVLLLLSLESIGKHVSYLNRYRSLNDGKTCFFIQKYPQAQGKYLWVAFKFCLKVRDTFHFFAKNLVFSCFLKISERFLLKH